VLMPTTGMLLRALRAELSAQVLPELPDGAARRQLKAALHILGRMERSWDRQAPYLEADNADLAQTMGAVLDELADDSEVDSYRQLRGRLDRTRSCPPEVLAGDCGVSDHVLRQLMSVNYVLQQLLADLQAALLSDTQCAGPTRQRVDAALARLHRRVVNRASAAAGTDDDR
jgi:hypothetical protein